MAAFQVFTKEYINLSGIAYNFWRDQYNLNDMLTNQILYHCAQVVGFFIILYLSDRVESSLLALWAMGIFTLGMFLD